MRALILRTTVHLSKILKEVRKQTLWKFGKKTFQTEGKVKAKALMFVCVLKYSRLEVFIQC